MFVLLGIEFQSHSWFEPFFPVLPFVEPHTELFLLGSLEVLKRRKGSDPILTSTPLPGEYLGAIAGDRSLAPTFSRPNMRMLLSQKGLFP